MQKSETVAEIAKALSKAQAEFGPLVKGVVNPFYKSRYSDLAAVMDVARGPLADNGLCLTQTTDDSPEGKLLVETTIIHISGEWITGRLTMPVPKADPQGYGSALTYARRYALQAILGLAAEDDDAESAMPRKNESKREPKPPAQHAPQQYAPQQPPPQSGPPTVRGIIEEVTVKEGQSAKGPWTRYGVKINGDWYGTFSKTIGESAESCQDCEVLLSFNDDGKNKTIVELVPVMAA